MFSPDGAEKGKTVIIGGFSPYIKNLPISILYEFPIIGMNYWPNYFACDYYVSIDTEEALKVCPTVMKDRNLPKFLKRVDDGLEKRDDVFFFDQAQREANYNHAYYVPTEWHNQLRYDASTAMAAISLAIIMGASDALLYGVDLVGGDRYDGSQYPEEGFMWEKFLNPINKLLKEFEQHITIWKMHPDSQLDVPMWPRLSKGYYLGHRTTGAGTP